MGCHFDRKIKELLKLQEEDSLFFLCGFLFKAPAFEACFFPEGISTCNSYGLSSSSSVLHRDR